MRVSWINTDCVDCNCDADDWQVVCADATGNKSIKVTSVQKLRNGTVRIHASLKQRALLDLLESWSEDSWFSLNGRRHKVATYLRQHKD